MAVGYKTGGRTKGTPNKRTADVIAKLAALGCDPIEGMARIAMDGANPVELRARMYTELAGYVAPKCKAVDWSGEEDAEAAPTELVVRFVDCSDPWGDDGSCPAGL
jgi:hypothetical protein